MTLDISAIRPLLAAGKFKNLFIDKLGWDNYNAAISIRVENAEYELTAVAEKHGVQVFTVATKNSPTPVSKRTTGIPHVDPNARTSSIPDYHTRKKIDRQTIRRFHVSAR